MKAERAMGRSPVPPDGNRGVRACQGDGADPSVTVRRNRSEEHTSELQSLAYLVCRLLLEKKKKAYSNLILLITQQVFALFPPLLKGLCQPTGISIPTPPQYEACLIIVDGPTCVLIHASVC